MSQFLSNLARRAAGLAVTPVQAPAPVPLAFEGALEVEDARHDSPPVFDDGVVADAPVATAAPRTVAPAVTAAVPAPIAPLQVSPRAPTVQRLAGPSPSPVLPALPRQIPIARPHEAHASGLADRGPAPASPVESSVRREIHIVEAGVEAVETGRVEDVAAPAPAIETFVQPRLDIPPAMLPPAAANADAPRSEAPLPVHVRIGRVEVRDTPAATPPAARTAPVLPRGFARYARLRNYRSYP